MGYLRDIDKQTEIYAKRFVGKVKTIFSNLISKLVLKELMVLISASLLSIACLSTPVFANPVGGQVAAGSAVIQQAPNTTTINQSSQKAIINWQSFNINQQETTHFQQPAGGVALNRINPSNGVSEIYGHLTASGRIVLINAAGIYFGPSAYVNVGGIIVSTADLSDQNFLNGIYHFTQSSSYAGSIMNAGQIIAANHGLVALIGSNVTNTGLIDANVGHIVLASGNAFTMTFAGNDMIGFSVDEKLLKAGVDQNGNPLRTGVRNTGKLSANGGHILVTADSAQGVLDNAIDMQGIAEAKSVGMSNGEIILEGEGAPVEVSGKLIASGKKSGETGGTVKVLGTDVALTGNASIDVSGDVGGGEVLIGGNAHGAGPELNADYTYVAPGVTINANAINAGNGGKVVVWSNLGTQFYGSIFAEGGAVSGNGGWVETSSKNFLDVNGGAVNTLAA
ncbi:MAG TPA: filamentous hemagglutinin N-terminal domain-containing protein, partial [Gammaproteobacteria bacterium]|nr:filamentous hemagglutinin N-terminal domain-containing protein [Gammaproteobacteria bacterium]